MAGKLEKVVQGMFDALSGRDPEGMLQSASEEMQGVDEISRQWMRGKEAVSQYIHGLVTQVEDVESEMKNVHEVLWGDIGLVTFWLEQDYTVDGDRHHISAPSSAVLRREDDEWKVVMFQSIPLPD